MTDLPEPAEPGQAEGASPAEGTPYRRGIRSFVTRAGRVSNAQGRALANLMPIYGIEYHAAPLDAAAAFGRTAPLVVEIGFGMGETTAAIALARPDVNFLGLEVHTPGVGSLLKQIEEQQIANLRVMQHDAAEVFEHMLAPGTLAGIHVFFPDPWPKARHHKRRLIQPARVNQLARRLAPGGYLHLATDWQNYAEQMLEVLRGEPLLENSAADYSGRTNPLVSRPQTKFEARGLRLGHGVWDLIFVRRS